MKETVLITGANSMIAQHVIPLLASHYNIKLLTRHPQQPNEYAWDTQAQTMDMQALDGVSYIIHLAGSKLNDGTPLTPARQQLVRSSRIGAADMLRNALKQRNQQIKSFVSASAIGIYDYADTTLTIDESGHQASGFIGDLCRDWEAAADAFKMDGVAQHVAKIRVSLVLGETFALFQNMKMAAQQDFSGMQGAYIPWNHVADMAGIFAFAMEHQLDGVYNSVAPVPATSLDIVQAIAHEMHLGTYDIAPYKGQHLVSNAIQAAGYTFLFPSIQSAVRDILQQA